MKVFTPVGDAPDDRSVEQLENCLADERAVDGALMADHHLGYSMPIGGVVAYQDAISPTGVGFDIACGNKAVQTEISDIQDVGTVMREIQQAVAFGLGRSNPEPIDHALFDSPVWDEIDLEPGQPLKQKARAQLGTVGSGNHYVDLLYDEDGYVWIANHFGSRGFGHTVATWFIAIAAGGKLGDRIPESEDPAVLDIGTPSGDLYVAAMRLAGEYAYAGRDYVIEQVLQILGNPKVTMSVHNHHNFAWLEDGLWVVRKGATPLTSDPAFIGGSMGDMSVIVHGTGDAIGALGSAPHGAGRVMSRTKAAGKFRKVKEERTREDGTTYVHQRRERDPSTAAVDWGAEKAALTELGVVVLGAGADEAPPVYKSLSAVLAAHSNVEVLHRLRPIGVVMAGDDTFDPYKD
jgi:tRNA-splicing ligase RtcB